MTRYPQAAEAQTASEGAFERRGRGWLPYLIAVAGALGALALVAVSFSALLRNQPVPTVAVLPTASSTPTALQLPGSPDPLTQTAAIAMLPATPSPLPTATSSATTPPTVLPTTPPPPTITSSLTFTATTIPPTLTSGPTLPPSPLPPSVTPTVVPTVPALAPPTTAPAAAPPTVLYPDGRLFVLYYDNGALYVASHVDQRIASGNFSFERLMIDGSIGEQFSGGKWAQYYPYIEPFGCLLVKQQGATYQSPKGECSGRINGDVFAVQKEIFWTTKDGSVEFRVLWKKSEVGRCQIADGRCEIRVPPTG